MNLKDTFQKQGGMKLLKQYWKSGALFTAVGEFALLGKSRTALEILRLSTGLKAKQKLEKKYKSELIKFDKEYNINLPHKSSNKIWICWFQGIENAPDIVKMCYQSIKENLGNREIILITSENMFEYVEFPNFIIKKWEQGIIKQAHMSDLLRLELLIKYGGLWLDATVLCTQREEEIPNYFFNSDLFFFQCLKPGRDGHSHFISNWLISAKSNNKLLMAIQQLCYSYWKDHNDIIDYFIFHHFATMVLEYYSEEWLNIIPRDNATPHILLLRFFEQYNEDIWNDIIRQTPFHKLSYKFKDEMKSKSNTYYKKLINRKE